MKSLIFLILGLAVAGCAKGQTSLPPASEWKATVKVVDEAGQPVAGADVEIGYYVSPPPGQSIAMDKKTGRTDTNGTFFASAHSRSVDLEFSVEKPGYYRTHQSYELGVEYDPIKWNPTKTFVLKKVISPIPMYARRVNLGLPVMGKPAGFDLVVSDWVAPYGKGITTDIIFTGKLDKKSEDDFDYKLTISFPNSGDGIQEFSEPRKSDGESALRSPHDAPQTGYQSELSRIESRHPGQPMKYDHDENRNYFFRVRTVLDEKGNIKSALYGKIYGDFLKFSYYLNPEPNSRNVEFDPKLNLLKGLKFTEQVKKP